MRGAPSFLEDIYSTHLQDDIRTTYNKHTLLQVVMAKVILSCVLRNTEPVPPARGI